MLDYLLWLWSIPNKERHQSWMEQQEACRHTCRLQGLSSHSFEQGLATCVKKNKPGGLGVFLIKYCFLWWMCCWNRWHTLSNKLVLCFSFIKKNCEKVIVNIYSFVSKKQYLKDKCTEMHVLILFFSYLWSLTEPLPSLWNPNRCNYFSCSVCGLLFTAQPCVLAKKAL